MKEAIKIGLAAAFVGGVLGILAYQTPKTTNGILQAVESDQIKEPGQDKAQQINQSVQDGPYSLDASISAGPPAIDANSALQNHYSVSGAGGEEQEDDQFESESGQQTNAD